MPGPSMNAQPIMNGLPCPEPLTRALRQYGSKDRRNRKDLDIAKAELAGLELEAERAKPGTLLRPLRGPSNTESPAPSAVQPNTRNPRVPRPRSTQPNESTRKTAPFGRSKPRSKNCAKIWPPTAPTNRRPRTVLRKSAKGRKRYRTA